jgi:hypothetical protein
MRTRQWIWVALWIASALGGSPTTAGQAEDRAPGALASFEKIKSLTGEWHAPEGQDTMINIFRPFAFGTAVLHEEWKSGEQLTSTVFYMVGSELRADHYCDYKNQPRYVALPPTDPNVVTFELRDITNGDVHPRHFHSTTWRFEDSTHLTQEWQIAGGGKETKVVRLEFTRQPKAQAEKSPQAVVREDLRALNEGDYEGLLAVFSPDAQVFSRPTDPDRLVGELSPTIGTHQQRTSYFKAMLAKSPRPRTELLDWTVLGELVVARLKVSDSPGNLEAGKADYLLAIFRIRDGLIQDLYHVGKAASSSSPESEAAQEVIRRLVVANNQGDVEAFLALFSPDSKYFRGSDDPHGLADKPSKKVYDQESRRKAFVAMFANGAPAQVEVLEMFAVGELVVSRDRATLPTGKVLEEITIYRVRGGLIQHDWFVLVEESS